MAGRVGVVDYSHEIEAVRKEVLGVTERLAALEKRVERNESVLDEFGILIERLEDGAIQIRAKVEEFVECIQCEIGNLGTLIDRMSQARTMGEVSQASAHATMKERLRFFAILVGAYVAAGEGKDFLLGAVKAALSYVGLR